MTKARSQIVPEKAPIKRESARRLALLGGSEPDLEITAPRRPGDLVTQPDAPIISMLEPRFGSRELAYDWYRSKHVPGFGDLTAEQLVRAGRADDVLNFLDAVGAGIYF